ncbi:GNAT family N-acetyltransferase [Breznakia pachnodae]|uniref:Acetyltransferase n=1 Tax=Breznakia pachnodae TaxID=265178 RepID=A0ABU0DYH0_9FIRM|nr:GNAT family N-acetyltransferase [Breznakia pachnodae]MDQ0359345.1 putative acetyltransferase [Breznakia pachnodae]
MKKQSTIQLVKVASKNKSLLFNLMQLYLYDLSVYFNFKTNNNGIYEYDHFEDYFTDTNYISYFIYNDNELIGFVLLNDYSPITNKHENIINVSEFFILKLYRKQGLGEITFQTLLDMHKGVWTIKPAAFSKEANAFWKTIINKHIGSKITIEFINNNPIYTFSNK